MTLRRGLYRVAEFNVNVGLQELAALGCRVFLLPTGIFDKRTFFEGVRSALPLDPPLVGGRSWDALADSLWGGLDAIEAVEVAIIWPESRKMAEAHPQDFELARLVLSDLAELLADFEATGGNVKHLVVLLA